MRAEDVADLAVGDGELVVARADIECRHKFQRCVIRWDALRRSGVKDVHSQRATPTPRWYTVLAYESGNGIHGERLLTSDRRSVDGI